MENQLQQIIKNMTNEKAQPQAKPKRELVWQFARRNLKISASTMKMLLAMSKYVDATNRVVIDLEDLACGLQMQKSTYNHVISEAIEHNLLYVKDGFFYSNFHFATTGNKSEYEYIQLLNEYTSASLLNYSLNHLRLFCYFLAATTIGKTQTYNIVQLYKNKVKKKKVKKEEDTKNGLDIFPTFKDLLEGLVVLLENDHIQLKLKHRFNGSFSKITCETPDKKKILFSHFGIEENSRKGRATNDFIQNELIEVRISKRIEKQKCKVEASEYELEQLALANNFSIYHMPENQVINFLSLKNAIVQMSPQKGGKIYFNTIRKYFNEKKGLLLSYADKHKAVDYYVNFYLLPELRNILTGVAIHTKDLTNNPTVKFKEILTNGYIIPTNDIGNLVSFYTKRLSKNELFKIFHAMRMNKIPEEQLLKGEWRQLQKRFEEELNPIINQFNLFIHVKTELYEVLDAFADKGWLQSSETLERILEQLKAGANQDSIKQLEERLEARKAPKVPFYNWLEERY